jgi:hypothetical protein
MKLKNRTPVKYIYFLFAFFANFHTSLTVIFIIYG